AADVLADGFAVGLDGRVRFEGADVTVAEGRGEELDGLGIGVARVLRRVPQDRGPVGAVVQPRLGLRRLPAFHVLPVRGFDVCDVLRQRRLGLGGGIGAGGGVRGLLWPYRR